MKSVLLYLVALYVAATHADAIGSALAYACDFVTTHLALLH